jgi:hypothetical protein
MPGKRVQFDQETWNALDLLAKDRMQDFQELADEAFTDLLHKHGRPVDLKTALRQTECGRDREAAAGAIGPAVGTTGKAPGDECAQGIGLSRGPAHFKVSIIGSSRLSERGRLNVRQRAVASELITDPPIKLLILKVLGERDRRP